jgi:hypothetical protein
MEQNNDIYEWTKANELKIPATYSGAQLERLKLSTLERLEAARSDARYSHWLQSITGVVDRMYTAVDVARSRWIIALLLACWRMAKTRAKDIEVPMLLRAYLVSFTSETVER